MTLYLHFLHHRALLKATFASEMDVIVPHTGGLKSPPLPLPKMTSSTIGTLRHDSKSPDAVCSNGPRMLTFNDIDNWTSAPLVIIIILYTLAVLVASMQPALWFIPNLCDVHACRNALILLHNFSKFLCYYWRFSCRVIRLSLFVLFCRSSSKSVHPNQWTLRWPLIVKVNLLLQNWTRLCLVCA